MDFITLSIGLVLGIFIGAGAIFIYLKLTSLPCGQGGQGDPKNNIKNSILGGQIKQRLQNLVTPRSTLTIILY